MENAANQRPSLATVDDYWQEFRETVIPRDARTAQQLDMKRAFYGGALALFGLQSRHFSGGSNPAMDQELMQTWLAEIESFTAEQDPSGAGQQ